MVNVGTSRMSCAGADAQRVEECVEEAKAAYGWQPRGNRTGLRSRSPQRRYWLNDDTRFRTVDTLDSTLSMVRRHRRWRTVDAPLLPHCRRLQADGPSRHGCTASCLIVVGAATRRRVRHPVDAAMPPSTAHCRCCPSPSFPDLRRHPYPGVHAHPHSCLASCHPYPAVRAPLTRAWPSCWA